MNTTNITIDGQTYGCRLTASRCKELERVLGKNPLAVMAGLPKITDVLTVFRISCGITEERADELYDSYIDEGHSLPDFIDFVMTIFTDSGFIRKDEEDSKN